jgi:hypothetical protein
MGRDYRSVVFKHQALLDIEALSLLQLCIAVRHFDALEVTASMHSIAVFERITCTSSCS